MNTTFAPPRIPGMCFNCRRPLHGSLACSEARKDRDTTEALAMRYTVAENRFGYEINGAHLHYAVVDNEPTDVSTYSPRERQFILVPTERMPHIAAGRPFRQIAFCFHRVDAENLARALNGGAS